MPLLRKYHKLCLPLVISCLFSLRDLQAQVPPFTSFLSTIGITGASVSLIETNFTVTPANNKIVFFGATRAMETSSPAISVAVLEAPSHTCARINSLNTGTSLAAYHLNNCTPIHTTTKTVFTLTDFLTKEDFTTGIQPISITIDEVDWSRQFNLAAVNQNSNLFSVCLYPSSTNSNGFNPKVDFATDDNLMISYG